MFRDLKLEHILVSSEGHIRLIDYGLARILNSPNEMCTTICGTPGYVSPEVWRLGRQETSNGYSFPVDYWAIGKIFLEMLFGELFDSTEYENELMNLVDNIPDYRRMSVEAQSLARGLLETDPDKRLGTPGSPHGDIRAHPFFRKGDGTNWQDVDDGVTKPIESKLTVRRKRRSDLKVSIVFHCSVIQVIRMILLIYHSRLQL